MLMFVDGDTTVVHARDAGLEDAIGRVTDLTAIEDALRALVRIWREGIRALELRREAFEKNRIEEYADWLGGNALVSPLLKRRLEEELVVRERASKAAE